jgi:hypothetical protein
LLHTDALRLDARRLSRRNIANKPVPLGSLRSI